MSKEQAIADLTESKQTLDALLTYANEATGTEDTSIGDAIRTLVDGYGQGGGSDLDNFMVWYSDDNVNWIPMTKHPNWDKTITNTKAHQMVDRTVVNLNGTVPSVSATNHWYMPVYTVLSILNAYGGYGGLPGNYTPFVMFGNALRNDGNMLGFDSSPTKIATFATSVTYNGDIVYTKSIKAGSGETVFPNITKIGFVLPCSSGQASCIMLGYCDIPPFQLSTTAKTFYIKITF